MLVCFFFDLLFQEVVLVLIGHNTVDEETHALDSHGTLDLVRTPPVAFIVGCRWVCTIKNKPDGLVDRYKS